MARVAGVRNNPDLRASMESGRKDDRCDVEVRRERSCDGVGRAFGEDVGNKMMGICELSDSTNVFSTGSKAASSEGQPRLGV